MKAIFLLILFNIFTHNAIACTEQVARVCGYWTHTPNTATFQNECKMREHGAQLRHTGSCADQNTKRSTQTQPTKSSK